MNFTKTAILALVFLLLLFYCVKSVWSLHKYVTKYTEITTRYNQLVAEKQKLDLELDALTKSVKGLRGKTLQPEVLKERLKVMLNYKDKKEYLLTN